MSVSNFLHAAKRNIKKQSEISEANIEKAYCDYALSCDCKAMKLVYLSRKGFPDRTTFCPGGRILFIEFKKKGKQLTCIQLKCRKLLESFGFTYHICDEKGDAEKKLDDFLSISNE